ncbi:Transposon Ty3-I Gag-Pol, partial [Paramuricea clavata]
MLQDKSCRSANFRKTCGGEENCELLKTVDSEEPTGSLKQDDNFDYYILLQPDRKPKDPVSSNSPAPITQTLSITDLSSCKGIKEFDLDANDGEYNLYLMLPECNQSARIFCADMNTTNPKEYVTLPAGGSNNFALHYNKQKGHQNEEQWSRFEKIRLNIDDMSIASEASVAKHAQFLCVSCGHQKSHQRSDCPVQQQVNNRAKIGYQRFTFKTYCNPRKNITFERHKFNIRNQDENESIDQYVTVLRTLAATCEFETLHDGLIRDRIVCGIRNQSIKERLLRESEGNFRIHNNKPENGKPPNKSCDYESDSSTHGIDMVKTAVTSDNDEEHASLKINNKTIRIKLDSGAETNVLTKKDFEAAVPKRQRRSKLKTSAAKLTAFGGHNIPVIGKCYLKCQYKGATEVLEFQVVETGKSLLGCTNCKSMKLITFHNVDQLRNQPINDASPQSSLNGLTTLRDRVQNELQEMESRGIIKKVNEPTAWVNSMVVNEKRSGKLRICIDPRDLNKALRREHYQLPTQQEITSRLTDAKFFSKLDANSGFWQMPLDEESSYLTTFNTPFGRYRFTVIPFGVVFAQEVFHKTVNEKFHDLPGCETDIDDILIWGRTLEEHDQNLERVLNRVTDINMTLSKDKCQFRQTKITYLGETLTSNGVKPDETKVEAIKNYPKPTNKHDFQRLLAKPVTLQVDASQNGLGAALIQNQGPVAYASKAMNDTQRRYAQIEKELLAVVFACKRFHQYVYGKTITVESDHKPLEAILKKSLSQAPSRLQKMLMQLQAYDINLVYKKGSE